MTDNNPPVTSSVAAIGNLNARQLILLVDLLTYAEQLLSLAVPHGNIADRLRERAEERRQSKRPPPINSGTDLRVILGRSDRG